MVLNTKKSHSRILHFSLGVCVVVHRFVSKREHCLQTSWNFGFVIVTVLESAKGSQPADSLIILSFIVCHVIWSNLLVSVRSAFSCHIVAGPAHVSWCRLILQTQNKKPIEQKIENRADDTLVSVLVAENVYVNINGNARFDKKKM